MLVIRGLRKSIVLKSGLKFVGLGLKLQSLMDFRLQVIKRQDGMIRQVQIT